jgi:hypothetical protein
MLNVWRELVGRMDKTPSITCTPRENVADRCELLYGTIMEVQLIDVVVRRIWREESNVGLCATKKKDVLTTERARACKTDFGDDAL